MGYYLFDNPPASLQFYPNRQTGLSGGVVIHTTEGVGGDDSAENTAGFISRRSDPGSYHLICDTNSTVMMLPDEAVAFGVAAPGYNSVCYMVAIAAVSADLNPNSPESQNEINRLGQEICAFWQRNNINPVEAAQFIGEEVKNRPGLAHHGDVQPWDRSDAWSRREDRWVFDSMLVQAICAAAGEAPLEHMPIVVPSFPESAVFTIGATGEKVKQIQTVVGATSDGIYGPQTADRVSVWQKNLGVTSDGIWGPLTEEATNNLFAFLANQPATNGPFLEAVNEATKQVLRQGSSGGPVKIAQLCLQAKGQGLDADGIFGPQTDSAVRNFQSDSGLQVDGIIGPDTWRALVS